MNATDQLHVNSLARLIQSFGEDVMLAAVRKATGQHMLLLSADELGTINDALQSHSDALRDGYDSESDWADLDRAIKDIAMLEELIARIEREFKR